MRKAILVLVSLLGLVACSSQTPIPEELKGGETQVAKLGDTLHIRYVNSQILGGSCTRTNNNTVSWLRYGYSCSFPGGDYSGYIYYGDKFTIRLKSSSPSYIYGADIVWIKWQIGQCLPAVGCSLYPSGERIEDVIQYGDSIRENPWPGSYVTYNVRPWANGTVYFELWPAGW